MASTRTTVASARLATKAVLPSGWITTLEGSAPVSTDANRELSSVLKTESEPASGFTIATRVSSSDMAIVLEREAPLQKGRGPAAAAAGVGTCHSARRTAATGTTAVASVAFALGATTGAPCRYGEEKQRPAPLRQSTSFV